MDYSSSDGKVIVVYCPLARRDCVYSPFNTDETEQGVIELCAFGERDGDDLYCKVADFFGDLGACVEDGSFNASGENDVSGHVSVSGGVYCFAE